METANGATSRPYPRSPRRSVGIPGSAQQAEHTAAALDVGGVIYYDEPFALSWIQGVYDRARADDQTLTMARFRRHLASFYRGQPGTIFSLPPARDSWLQVRRTWVDLVQPIPGAADAVAALADNLTVGVVANQPPECLDALEHLGLAAMLKPVALDSLVGYTKPDVRLFEWALSRIDCESQDVLVVGNRLDHDVRPALALGCSPVLVRPHSGWRTPRGISPDISNAYDDIVAAKPTADPSPATRTVNDLAQLAADLFNDSAPSSRRRER